MVKTIENITLFFGSDENQYTGDLIINTNEHYIYFEDSVTKEPIADICKIVPALQPGEFAIKNYSENEGVYPQLITLGIIQPAHRYHSQGYVSFPICKLKIDEL